MTPHKLIGAAALCSTALALPTAADTPVVNITLQGDQRCITSNGVPNHDIGQFPNRGNPNRFRAQRLKFCFPANPKRFSRPTHGTANVGIALNGIVIRPGTADWYDSSSRRGFSRNRASGWNLEGMGSAQSLGMDHNNAHVDNRGLYHYHGVPVGLLKLSNKSHIGYAADGFEIHYVGAKAKPSYVLKAGVRPTAPGGRYDGRFLQDWQFAAKSGNLDQCNGGVVNGRYTYFTTDTFPFYPRCHWGKVSADFERRGRVGPPRRAGQHRRPDHGAAGPGQRRGNARGGPLAAAARELGISEHELAEAVGPPPPDVRRAARSLGIPEGRLREVLRRHRPR